MILFSRVNFLRACLLPTWNSRVPRCKIPPRFPLPRYPHQLSGRARRLAGHCRPRPIRVSQGPVRSHFWLTPCPRRWRGPPAMLATSLEPHSRYGSQSFRSKWEKSYETLETLALGSLFVLFSRWYRFRLYAALPNSNMYYFQAAQLSVLILHTCFCNSVPDELLRLLVGYERSLSQWRPLESSVVVDNGIYVFIWTGQAWSLTNFFHNLKEVSSFSKINSELFYMLGKWKVGFGFSDRTSVFFLVILVHIQDFPG